MVECMHFDFEFPICWKKLNKCWLDGYTAQFVTHFCCISHTVRHKSFESLYFYREAVTTRGNWRTPVPFDGYIQYGGWMNCWLRDREWVNVVVALSKRVKEQSFNERVSELHIQIKVFVFTLPISEGFILLKTMLL